MKRIFGSDFNIARLNNDIIEVLSKGNLKNKKTNFIRLLENKLNTSKKSEKIAEYTRIVNL